MIPSKTSRGDASVPERLKALDRTERHAVLATASGDQPYTSLIAFALMPDLMSIVFATPRETTKYRNILGNRKVSVLIDKRTNTDRGYMGAEAVTVVGTAEPLRKGKTRDHCAEILAGKHPGLAAFIGSPSTALVRIRIEHCFHVTSFQKVSHWHPKRSGRGITSRQPASAVREKRP